MLGKREQTRKGDFLCLFPLLGEGGSEAFGIEKHPKENVREQTHPEAD